MANNIIQHKRTDTAGKQPLLGSLQQGELALNLHDRKIFTKDHNNLIVTIGSGNITGLADVSNATPNVNDILVFTGTKYEPNAIIYASNVYVDGVFATKANIADLTTSNVSEGTNLYFTNARALAGVVDQGGNVVIGTTTVNISGSATTIAGLVQVDIGNLRFADNQIVSTDTDGNIYLSPNGTGAVDVGSSRITNVSMPVEATDATNKLYVDELVQGLKTAPSVKAATVSNLSGTYDNGNAGIGANITLSPSATLDIDNVTSWSRFDGVLVKDQSNAEENGRYYIDQVGDASNSWILTRCQFCDESSEVPGLYVFVTSGDTYQGTGFVAIVTDPDTFVIGTDDIIFTQFSGAGTYIAGNGLVLSDTTFNINLATNGGLDIVSDQLRLDSNIGGFGLDLSSGVLSVNNNEILLAVVDAGISTSNVAEGTNLYFSNARVLGALADNTATVGNLVVTGNLYVQGDLVELNAATLIIEDKNIVLANGAPDAATADGAGITIEGANATLTYASAGNVWVFDRNVEINGNAALTTGSTTNDLPEGANLYYTDTRAREAISVIGAGSYNNATGVITITGGVESVAGATGNVTNTQVLAGIIDTGYLTTANVVEVTNLYYTNARVFANVSEITTTTIAEGANLYFTNTRVFANVAEITTTTISEGSNLYFTNARVFANVSEITTTTIAEGTSLYFTNARVEAYITDSITTSNIAEGTNLYFTNTRAIEAFTAGTGVVIDSNGLISTSAIATLNDLTDVDVTNANVNDVLLYNGNTWVSTSDFVGNFLAVMNSDSFVANGTGTTFVLSTSATVYSPNATMVFVDGVIQKPDTNYTVSGNTITFTSAPEVDAEVEVRYFIANTAELNVIDGGSY